MYVRELFHTIKHIVAYLEIVHIQVGTFIPSDVEVGWKTLQERMHAGRSLF